MRHRFIIAALALLFAGGLVLAQDPEAEKTRPEGEKQSAIERLKERMRDAIQLPRSAEEAREAGVDEEKVREVLRTGRDNGVSAEEMKEIIDTENAELRQGGNPENFGAAVQAMKASGLRGRELADAIHAEQAARGMKKQNRHRERVHTEGYGKGQGPGAGAGKQAGGSQGQMKEKEKPRGGEGQSGEKKQESGSQGGKGKGKGGGRS
jgi:hypothetical protein